MGYQPSRRDGYTKPFKHVQIALGNDSRYGLVNKFGSNLDVGTSFEDIWSNGGNLSYLSSAETMNIVSTDADDDGNPADTGAQKVIVQGVDANYNQIQEEVVMNGTTNVLTTNSYLRVYRMWVTDVGSSGVNEGTITATASTAGTVQASIDAGEGQTLMALYTVPVNYYAVVTGFNAQTGGNDTALIELLKRQEGKSWRLQNQSNVTAGSAIAYSFLPGCAPILLEPKSDIRIRAKKSGAGGTTEVSAVFSLLLIDEREVTS